MKEVKVKGCSDCPFSQIPEEGMSERCIISYNDEPLYMSLFTKNYYPSWCPLLTEPITIKLDKDGDTEDSSH